MCDEVHKHIHDGKVVLNGDKLLPVTRWSALKIHFISKPPITAQNQMDYTKHLSGSQKYSKANTSVTLPKGVKSEAPPLIFK